MPGMKVSFSPSQLTHSSGVKIDQSMLAKRFSKNGAASRVMRYSGSNQATNCSRPFCSFTPMRRKRTKACILWISRLTAFAHMLH